jgi:replicative DNA helicase
MANSLNIHLIVIVHVNREGAKTGQVPKIFDLKGGSGIEQSADYVVFVHRDVSPDAPDEVKENVEIAIAKNRIEGSTGIIHFKYYSDRCDYEEI